MRFNSLDFAFFLPIVFVLYWLWFYKNNRSRSIFLTAVSYVFYGWWDYRFLGLIVISTLCDYIIGIALEKNKDPQKRKLALWLSVAINLGILGFFKYCNFFVEAFQDAFSVFGYTLGGTSLEILLPVGISFYTFQTLSYTIDVYRKDIKACHDLGAFAAYVSFFPQLVAGPIERAKNLLPQFYNAKKFDPGQAIYGLRLILFGLFKKMVVADQCALVVNAVYQHPENQSSVSLAVATLCFAVQIYGDFSGYTDIAIGTARLFGFKLSKNFAYPYFSRSIAEFWRRWHISLTTWFKDYLYIPLGGSRAGKSKTLRNVFIIFLVSGFWHGASWNFILWGGIHASLFLPSLLTNSNRKHLNVVPTLRSLSGVKNLVRLIVTGVLVVLAWVPFRAENLSDTLTVYRALFLGMDWSLSSLSGERQIAISLGMAGILFAFEWRNRHFAFAMDSVSKWRKGSRWMCYMALGLLLLFFASMKETPFIYFQF